MAVHGGVAGSSIGLVSYSTPALVSFGLYILFCSGRIALTITSFAFYRFRPATLDTSLYIVAPARIGRSSPLCQVCTFIRTLVGGNRPMPTGKTQNTCLWRPGQSLSRPHRVSLTEPAVEQSGFVFALPAAAGAAEKKPRLAGRSGRSSFKPQYPCWLPAHLRMANRNSLRQTSAGCVSASPRRLSSLQCFLLPIVICALGNRLLLI